MLFRIDGDGTVGTIPERELAELGLRERDDLQEWVIEEPRILGEELLVVTSEYAGFDTVGCKSFKIIVSPECRESAHSYSRQYEETLDRLDVLALDREGKLVVIELKRDRADNNTDLQALKYASFCSTLSGEDIQQLYRAFREERHGESIPPEKVGDQFVSFLENDEAIARSEEGWVEFDLDDRPRVLLAAGDFGTEVTSPVLWLYQEYGLEITCVRLSAYERDGEYLVRGERIIPVPEAEEYMTKRRQKQEQQQSDRRPRAITVLLDRGVLRKGDELLFNEEMFGKDWAPNGAEERWDPEADLWQAAVTGKEGRNDNIRWRYDGNEYSFTGLAKAVLRELGEAEPYVSTGYWYWTIPNSSSGTYPSFATNR